MEGRRKIIAKNHTGPDEQLSAHALTDGKETKTSFETLSSRKPVDGEVKITAVTVDTVSGEVNLTEADKSIKGSFTANLPKKR